LDAIEKAIRNAFEKGDAEDRAYREKVYRSAFAALDRAIQANPGITVEKAIARRRDLQAKIAIIESEFLPAVRAAAAGALADPVPVLAGEAPDLASSSENGGKTPAIDPVLPAGRAVPATAEHGARPADARLGRAPDIDRASGGGSKAPSIDPVRPDGRGAAPALEHPSRRLGSGSAPEPEMPEMAAPAGAEPWLENDRDGAQSREEAGGIEVAPDRDERRVRERGRSWGTVLFAITLLSAAAIGGWWGYRTGLLGPQDGGSVPNPPPIVEGEDFAPGNESGPPPVTGADTAARDWISVFSPADPSQISAPSGTTAEVMRDESGSFLRIQTGGAAVVFDVGQGILERIAGRRAVFDIAARTEGEQTTQMSVDCDFGELGDCGRKRYEVGYERSEYLFEVDLPDAEPGAAGSIAINSDFEDQGRAVDIYEIRVSVDE
jgi:hypothetical protein